jgi:hypothetical protein
MTKILNALRALFTPPAPPTLAQRLIALHLLATTPRKTLQ